MTTVVTLRPAQPYEYHPFSNIWPLLEGEAFDDFATDIAANGLLVPILLYQDKILDGRNRDRACIEAGVEPRYEKAKATNDEEALELVFSLNQHRRHLSFEERVFAAARYANAKSGGQAGNINRYGGSSLSRDRLDADPALDHGAISVREAARKFDVAPASVSRARNVIEHGGPELEKKVKAKKVGLQTAANSVRPKRKPRGPVAQTRGLPVAARVPVVDISKRRILTPQQVDPEFTGTSNEFTTKYGHVQLETAEERAANRFMEWTIHIRKWARDYKDQGALSEIDVNWLRSPRQKDVDSFLESYNRLALVFDNIQSIRDKAKALKKKGEEDA
jgi:hypothetical protein